MQGVQGVQGVQREGGAGGPRVETGDVGTRVAPKKRSTRLAKTSPTPNRVQSGSIGFNRVPAGSNFFTDLCVPKWSQSFFFNQKVMDHFNESIKMVSCYQHFGESNLN